jgi:hypothetical protein
VITNNGRSHRRHATATLADSVEFAELLDPIRPNGMKVAEPQPKPVSRFAAADAGLDDDRLPVYTKPRGSRR